MWIGLDDTDSPRGMCTTYLVPRLLEALPETRLLRAPRLVRLNPMVPWKTRGNGAVAVEISDELSAGEAYRRIESVVRQHADLSDPNTNPGIVVTKRRPPRSLYEAAVTRLVSLSEAEGALRSSGALYGGMNGSLGLIGAASAIAWEPGDHTWELMGYRNPQRFGTRREVDEASVAELAVRFPSTFDSYDFENEEVVMVPGSPCPVLWGIRGDDPREVRRASLALRGEPPAETVLFETNHGTDDHVVPATAATRKPYTSVSIRGRVAAAATTLRGGHVCLPVEDPTGAFDCFAFEPTRGFRGVVRSLVPGDEIEAVGGVGPRLAVNLEKLRILSAGDRRRKIANPRCFACRGAMKSAGRGAPYRCRRCGARAPRASARFLTASARYPPGWYEVPSRARRHLAKPLKRMSPNPTPGQVYCISAA